MTTITLPRSDIPIAGQFQPSGDWYRWARDITARVGGVTGSSTTDLEIAQFEDAGVEETKSLLFAARDEAGQWPTQHVSALVDDPLWPAVVSTTFDDQLLPVFQAAQPYEDQQSEIASLREEIALLRARLDALEQGNEQ